MNRYQPYLTYKESGVEWLGEVPEHWQSIKFKHILFEKKKETNIDLNCGSISFGEVVFKDDEKIPEETKASYQEVLAGEFLVNPLNLNYDLKSLRTALSKIDVVVSSGYIVLKSHDNSNKNYLRWLLYQFDVAHMKTLGSGVRQTINYADIGNSYFLEPTPDEQTAIANFLDRETAKIDTLIVKQDRMIELLNEKRSAIISHAVTKGIDPNMNMKDSGVEWLGEVPEHWVVSVLGYVSSINSGSTPDRTNQKYWNGNIPWVKTGEVNYSDIKETEEYITDQGLQNSSLKLADEGTLLMAMYGQGVTRGRVAILHIKATYNQACAAITFNQKLFNVYGKYFFIAAYSYIRDFGNETSQMNLNTSIIEKMKILVPPLHEQKDIVQYLDTQTAKIDTLIDKARQAIELMKERRTALISTAVTGKIDVREMA